MAKHATQKYTENRILPLFVQFCITRERLAIWNTSLSGTPLYLAKTEGENTLSLNNLAERVVVPDKIMPLNI
jgi:hypothetical protein